MTFQWYDHQLGVIMGYWSHSLNNNDNNELLIIGLKPFESNVFLYIILTIQGVSLMCLSLQHHHYVEKIIFRKTPIESKMFISPTSSSCWEDNIVIPQFDWLCDVCGCVMSPTSSIYWVELNFVNNCKEP